jgi:dihydroorotase
MKQLITNATVYYNSQFVKKDILINDEIIAEISDFIAPECADFIYNFEGCYLFPGFTDVHVHLREPGFSYKETIKSGTLASARGGYTSVCSMPNLNPVPDSVEHIQEQIDIIKKDAVINVYPYASITVNQMGEELSDLSEMTNLCIAYSDDGRGVQSDNMMLNAMKIAKAHDKMIVAHCEVNDLLNGGYIHKGIYAEEHNHRGICSESEWKQIERDIQLVKETGCSYHVCHISTKESVELIRQAKKDGVDITCETGPHYLVLSDKDLQEHGRFKMNPPLRDESDREALIQGVLDGTIDMIATDHAPHSAEEKSKGLEKSNMGVVGIETAFPIMYTHFVKSDVMTLEKLIELLSINANKRFKIGTCIKVGEKADLTVFDLNDKYTVNPDDFLSMGKSTPFEGVEVYGKCKMTICNGKVVWEAQ